MSYNPLQPRGNDGKWVSKGLGIVAGKSAKKRKSSAKSARAKKGSGGVVQTRPVRKTRGQMREVRGVGLTGLKKNTVPYARVNKRSQTVGINAGTIIPGTKKRIAIGGYARLENTHTNKLDEIGASVVAKAGITKNSRVSKIYRKVKSQVGIRNPALRKTIGSSQVRLGTSRRAGPTVIVRKGSHKQTRAASMRGIARYDNRMARIAGKRATRKKMPRAQRRKAARSLG